MQEFRFFSQIYSSPRPQTSDFVLENEACLLHIKINAEMRVFCFTREFSVLGATTRQPSPKSFLPIVHYIFNIV